MDIKELADRFEDYGDGTEIVIETPDGKVWDLVALKYYGIGAIILVAGAQDGS